MTHYKAKAVVKFRKDPRSLKIVCQPEDLWRLPYDWSDKLKERYVRAGGSLVFECGVYYETLIDDKLRRIDEDLYSYLYWVNAEIDCTVVFERGFTTPKLTYAKLDGSQLRAIEVELETSKTEHIEYRKGIHAAVKKDKRPFNSLGHVGLCVGFGLMIALAPTIGALGIILPFGLLLAGGVLGLQLDDKFGTFAPRPKQSKGSKNYEKFIDGCWERRRDFYANQEMKIKNS